MVEKKKASYDALMRKARKRVESMDAVDGSNMAAHPLDEALRTVMMALECAINMGDWDVVGDAQVMLSQIELRYRPADLQANGYYLKEKP